MVISLRRHTAHNGGRSGDTQDHPSPSLAMALALALALALAAHLRRHGVEEHGVQLAQLAADDAVQERRLNLLL